MKTIPAEATAQVAENDWVTFSGGELEGKRPRTLCAACQSKLNRQVNRVRPPDLGTSQPLCFQCYRAELDRSRAIEAAAELAAVPGAGAPLARFQVALLFEPVNRARLACLKIERRNARARQSAAHPFADRRRQAQIRARHVLQRLAEGLRARSAGELPFVASR